MPELAPATDERVGRGPPVDPDHPWLGLRPFTEENQHYFFGRSREIREIFVRIRDNSLTVLYGQSGIGKTSLLRAGAIPKLRVEGFRPVHVLLDFEPEAHPLLDQVRRALARACETPEKDADALLREWSPLASLWQIFTHESLRPVEVFERPPVLIFDQFEEVLRLDDGEGEGTPPAASRRAELPEFFAQIGDLIENRAPTALLKSFRDDPGAAMDYDFGPTPARIVIALREEYLAHLEEGRGVVPSLMGNRLRLRLLNGPSALEAVVRPGRMQGRNLVSDEVGAKIVRFVAEKGDETPLEEIEAVPPLLSLLCERLNHARSRQDPVPVQITDDLVEAHGRDILQSFYDESFSAEALPDCSPEERRAVRRFVEDYLVTRKGHRNAVAHEDAFEELATSGVKRPDAALGALIVRRLLTTEQRGGTQRLEITHDVVAPLVVRSRDARRSREAREAVERKRREVEAAAAARSWRRLRRILTYAGALLAAVACAGFVLALVARDKAEEAETEAKHSHGVALVERAMLEQAVGDRLVACVLAARAIGFEGYGRQSPRFQSLKEKNPVLLDREDPAPWKKAERVLSYAPLLELPISSISSRTDDASPVVALAWRPDGRTLAVSFENGDVELANPASDVQSPPLEEAPSADCMAWSPDGKQLALGTADGGVHLLQGDTGEVVSLGRVEDDNGESIALLSLSWHPDGVLLAGVLGDGAIRMWSVAGRPVFEHTVVPRTGGDHNLVQSVSWCPDGRSLAGGFFDGAIRLWDTDVHEQGALPRITVKRQMEQDAPTSSPVLSLAWSPCGRTLASGSQDSVVRLWNANTGRPDGDALAGHTDEVLTVAFSPDGRTLASGSRDRTIRLWEVGKGEERAILHGHAGAVRSVDFCPDGAVLASGSEGGTVLLWNVAMGAPRTLDRGHDEPVRSLVWSRDGRTLASLAEQHSIALWDAASGALCGEFGRSEDAISAVAFSPDARTLAGGSVDGAIRFWDVSTGEARKITEAEPAEVVTMAWSPDGKTLHCVHANGALRTWDATTTALVTEHEGLKEGQAYSAAWSPDARTVALGMPDGSMRLRDADTGGLTESVEIEDEEGTPEPATCLAWRPNGAALAFGTWSGRVEIWERGIGMRPLLGESVISRGTSLPLSGVAWHPGGRTVAGATEDGVVQIWEADSIRLRATLRSRTGAYRSVRSVAWRPDGTTLACGHDDGRIRLWEDPLRSPDLGCYETGEHAHSGGSGGPSVTLRSSPCNVPVASLVRLHRSSLSLDEQEREELRLFLRAGNRRRAVESWRRIEGALPPDDPIRVAYVRTLCSWASEDVESRVLWRAVRLVEAVRRAITPEVLEDPVTSLAARQLHRVLAGLVKSPPEGLDARRSTFVEHLKAVPAAAWWKSLVGEHGAGQDD